MLDDAPGLPSDFPVRSSSGPGPIALAAFVIITLTLSALVMLHQEHAYENDPALRARAGLVTAASDISFLRTANFGAALAKIGAQAKAGDKVRSLSVTPTKIEATLVSTSGAETDVTVSSGLNVKTSSTGNRVSDRSGVAIAAFTAAAPARILRAAQLRFHLLPADFDELFLDPPSGPNRAGWAAKWSQPTDDDGLIAALDGTDVRRPFAPAKASR